MKGQVIWHGTVSLPESGADLQALNRMEVVVMWYSLENRETTSCLAIIESSTERQVFD